MGGFVNGVQLLVSILKGTKRFMAVQNGKRELRNGKLGKKKEVWLAIMVIQDMIKLNKKKKKKITCMFL